MTVFRTLTGPVFILTVLAILAFTGPGLTPAGKGKLTIRIQNYVGKEILHLDTANYTNAIGQSYTVSMFKYYIGQITLKKTDGTEYKSDQYFLVNEEDENSKYIILNNIPG